MAGIAERNGAFRTDTFRKNGVEAGTDMLYVHCREYDNDAFAAGIFYEAAWQRAFFTGGYQPAEADAGRKEPEQDAVSGLCSAGHQRFCGR